jgi:uncharacterized SAM-binding protein YcdF (DUF218 family)
MDERVVKDLARRIWDYHQMRQALQKADCILVLGSHDTRVAERGAQLYLEGWAPLLVLSGGRGDLTRHWTCPEAEVFCQIAIEMGVPAGSILVEDHSANTGENIRFTRQLLATRGLDPQRFILVQKPYMERRAYATFRRLWPEKEAVVTSPQISFEAYPNEAISLRCLINLMVGDLQRIRLYPARGYQIAQEIPPDVWEAYEQLVSAGYTERLTKE